MQRKEKFAIFSFPYIKTVSAFPIKELSSLNLDIWREISDEELVELMNKERKNGREASFCNIT